MGKYFIFGVLAVVATIGTLAIVGSGSINDVSRRVLDATSSEKIRKSACSGAEKTLKDIDADQRKYSKDFRTTQRKKWRSDNKFEKIVQGDGFDAGDNVDGIVAVAGVYLVFTIISLFSTFCYYFCCCCDKCCPPCKCCANKEGKCCGCQCVRKVKYEKKELIVSTVFLVLCLTALMIISIIGMANAGGIEDGVTSMHCSIVDTMYKFNYGTEFELEGQKQIWQGVSKLGDRLQTVSDDMNTDFIPSIKTTFSNPTTFNQLEQSETDMKSAISTMRYDYTGLTGITVTQADSSSPATVVSYDTDPSGQGVTARSCFFSADTDAAIVADCNSNVNTGQDATTDTPAVWDPVCNEMNNIITTTIEKSIEQTKEVQSQGTSMENDAQGVSNSISDGAKEIKDFVKKIDDQQKDMDDYMGNASDMVKDMITPVLTAIFVVFLVFSLLLAGLGGAMLFFEFYKLRCVFHISWMFFTFLSFILFFLTTIFMIVSLVGSELCDFLYRSINNQEEFLKLDIDSDIKTKMTTCSVKMNPSASGDLLASFNVKKELNRIDDLIKQMDEYKATIDEGQAGLADLATKLSGAQVFLRNLQDGAYAANLYDDKRILKAMEDLNTNSATLPAGCQDNWVSKKDGCSASQFWWFQSPNPVSGQTVYQYINDDAAKTQYPLNVAGQTGTGFTAGTAGCIWWNGQPYPTNDHATLQSSKGSNSSNEPFYVYDTARLGMLKDGVNPNTINRYVGGACNNAANVAIFNSLLNWRTSKNILAQKKLIETADFLKYFDDYKTNQGQYSTSIDKFKVDTQDIVTQINQAIDISLNNCKFIGEQLDTIYDGMCVLFFPNWYKFAQILAAFSFILLFSSLGLFIYAMRMSKNANLKDKETIIPQDGAKVDVQQAKTDGQV